jgi:hypothetical protein
MTQTPPIALGGRDSPPTCASPAIHQIGSAVEGYTLVTPHVGVTAPPAVWRRNRNRR